MSSLDGVKKKRANIVYSQPADTGTGNNVNTQLVYAVNHLRVRTRLTFIRGRLLTLVVQSTHNPMRLQDIAIVTNTPVDTDRVLLEKFRAHDRVQWDPKTDLYSYKVCCHWFLLCYGRFYRAHKHEFNFRSKAALLTEIQRQTRKGTGISVRALKESWKDAPQAVEELEAEGEVLVTRTMKDGQLRSVFWNEIKPTEEMGGMKVEKGPFPSTSSLGGR